MGNLKETDKAYIAGYFDGEGTFSIGRQTDTRSPNGFTLQPYCSVASTSPIVIELLDKQIEGTHRRFTMRGRNNSKDIFQIQISGTEKIINFIKIVSPYLHLKKIVADKLLIYCQSRLGKMKLPKNERKYTEKELSLFNEIRQLNKRGRR
jgi:hypothetical protein